MRTWPGRTKKGDKKSLMLIKCVARLDFRPKFVQKAKEQLNIMLIYWRLIKDSDGSWQKHTEATNVQTTHLNMEEHLHRHTNMNINAINQLIADATIF